jgi:hypothetical protein
MILPDRPMPLWEMRAWLRAIVAARRLTARCGDCGETKPRAAF